MKNPFVSTAKKEQLLIEEIHHEFDSAQERLLNQAKELIASTKIDEDSEVEKIACRHKAIGFMNTPVVKKAEIIGVEKSKKEIVLVKTKEQADLIGYYATTYPFNKFLTDEELDRICNKYGLIHAPVKNYTQDIPEKNVYDIEIAKKLSDGDIREESHRFFFANNWSKNAYEVKATEFLKKLNKNEPVFTEKEFKELLIKYYQYAPPDWSDLNKGKYSNTSWFVITEFVIGEKCSLWDGVQTIGQSGLFIAAPPSHFDLKELKKKTKHGWFSITEVVAKDPIVFEYVRGGFVRILTKWGLEANDPTLVVPQLN